MNFSLMQGERDQGLEVCLQEQVRTHNGHYKLPGPIRLRCDRSAGALGVLRLRESTLQRYKASTLLQVLL